MARKKKQMVYKGVAITNFVYGTKNPMRFVKGQEFETTKESVYNSLINLKKIK